MIQFELPHSFGDYTLVAYLGTTRGGVLYQGIQQGMDRSVFLEIFDEDNPLGVPLDEFLAEARVRAGMNVPVLGAVYEAAQAEGLWFITSEYLPGQSLQAMADKGETLGVREFLKVIDSVAKLCDRFDTKGILFDVLPASLIFVTDKGNVRMYNTSLSGQWTPEPSNSQMIALGYMLAQVVPTQGVAGATRMATFAEWMMQGKSGNLKSWEQVLETGEYLREQLGLVPKVTTHRYTVPTEPASPMKKWGIIGAAAVAVIVGVCVALTNGAGEGGASATVKDERPARYPDFSRSDHNEVMLSVPNVGQIYVGAHEVTIEAYHNFLKQWEKMMPERKEKFSHPDQPDKLSATHKPKDWEAMLRAARKNGTWQGKPITMRSPVMNITWWDAYAFASWKPVAPNTPHYRLPTMEEWQGIAAQMKHEAGDKTTAIDQYCRDYDWDTGVCGMASGVMEWTSTIAKNPARLKEPAGVVVCGGDRDNPGVKDRVQYLMNKDECRPNLGFRLVRDKK